MSVYSRTSRGVRRGQKKSQMQDPTVTGKAHYFLVLGLHKKDG